MRVVMLYPRAYIYVSLLLLLTFPAFWLNYYSQLSEVPWQFHLHGVSATLWMLLLIWQSWTIHHRRRELHRKVGLVTFVMTPVFLAGSLLVIASMASGGGPFRAMFGTRLGLADVISFFTFTALIYGAFRHRRDVALHSSYMLATPFLLVSPVVSRLFPAFVPGLTIRSVEEIPRFAGSFHLSQGLAILLALLLFFRNRQARPFLVVAIVIAVQSLVFETAGRTVIWSDINEWIGTLSPVILACFAGLLGIAATWFGWANGRPNR